MKDGKGIVKYESVTSFEGEYINGELNGKDKEYIGGDNSLLF